MEKVNINRIIQKYKGSLWVPTHINLITKRPLTNQRIVDIWISILENHHYV